MKALTDQAIPPEARARRANTRSRLCGWRPGMRSFPGLLAGILARQGEVVDPRLVRREEARFLHHLLRGDIETAIECVRTVIDQRDPISLMLASSTALEPLREHPRWREVARKMNLRAEP